MGQSNAPNLGNYVMVDERLREFFKQYPDGRMRPMDPDRPFWIERIPDASGNEQTYIVYAAAAYRTPDDPAPAIGMAYELFPGRTPYTRFSELMNAETSAWGRALAAMGIGISGKIASADEVYAATQRRAEPEEPQAPARSAQAIAEAAYDAQDDVELRDLWREAGRVKLNSGVQDPQGETVVLGDVIKDLRKQMKDAKAEAAKAEAAQGAGSDAA